MKSLNLIKPAILLFIATSFSSLAASAQETKNIAVNNFSGVSVSAGIELILTPGSSESAKVVASHEFIEDVLVEKNGSTVTVRWKQDNNFNNGRKNKSAKVYITYKKLNSITASSGSSLTTEGAIKTDRLDAKTSSGASMNATINCTDFQLQLSSGATVNLKGTAANTTLRASSGATLNGADLVSETANVTASSGAVVNINVTKELEASSGSGGVVSYKGNPSVRNISKSRSSVVRKAD